MTTTRVRSRATCRLCGSGRYVRPDVIFPSFLVCATCADDLAVRDDSPPTLVIDPCPLCGLPVAEHTGLPVHGPHG